MGGALFQYFAAIARTYPKHFGPIWKNINKETPVPMDDLRAQLWQLRAEYWYRKFASAGSTWNAAKADAKQIGTQIIRNPGDFTYKQIGTGAVWGVQIAGCFALGEMYGRRNIRGYEVGDWVGAPHMQHH